MKDPLGSRHVQIIRESRVVRENIDLFITGALPSDRRWESHSLTQVQNVRRWIDDPSQIEALQPHLYLFAECLRDERRTKSVLDVGCYGGYLLDYLHGANALSGEDSYLGLDVDASSVDAATKAHTIDRARFEVGDVYRLGALGRTFDYVWCSRVLIHLPYFQLALLNLLKVTRRKLYLTILVGREGCKKIHIKDLFTKEESSYYYRTVSIERIEAVARPIPFTVDSFAAESYALVVFDKEGAAQA